MSVHPTKMVLNQSYYHYQEWFSLTNINLRSVIILTFSHWGPFIFWIIPEVLLWFTLFCQGNWGSELPVEEAVKYKWVTQSLYPSSYILDFSLTLSHKSSNYRIAPCPGKGQLLSSHLCWCCNDAGEFVSIRDSGLKSSWIFGLYSKQLSLSHPWNIHSHTEEWPVLKVSNRFSGRVIKRVSQS